VLLADWATFKSPKEMVIFWATFYLSNFVNFELNKQFQKWFVVGILKFQVF
jgi:hypothetical protein